MDKLILPDLGLNVPEMSDHHFDQVAELIRTRFGFSITEENKISFIVKIRKAMDDSSFNSMDDYLSHLFTDKTGQSLDKLINRISVNHTYFYRENTHFSYLYNTIFPEILDKGQNVRIWCCGCATGEEAYTIAITAREFLKTNNLKNNIAILATDISGKALYLAGEGIYSEDNLKNLPMEYIDYFKPLPNSKYSVRPDIRTMVTFRRLNLLSPFPFKHTFHVIFCRNVMIYFENSVKSNVIAKFNKFMHQGSYLFTGHSEKINHPHFLYQLPAIYKKENNAA